MEKRERYEYRIIKGDRGGKYNFEPDIDKIELELTGLGLEGWRLVQTQHYTNTSGIVELLFILERALPDEPEIL